MTPAIAPRLLQYRRTAPPCVGLPVLLSAACFLLFFGGCTSPKSSSNPASPGSTLELTLEASPQTLPADGASRLVAFAELRRGGAAVNDSTEIVLRTTIGTLGRGIVFTQSGVALDTLTSDTTARSGWLIAYSDGLRDSVAISFTAVE